MSGRSDIYRFVNLSKSVPKTTHEGRAVEWVRARVGKDRSVPLAVIDYKVDGEEQRYGLRLDLSKRAFLDRPDDQGLADKVDEAIPAIVRAIGLGRRRESLVGSAMRRRMRLKRSDSHLRLRSTKVAG